MTHDEARVEKVLDPPFTLRRIAFLLERAQAPTYRVQAFGKAAAAIDEGRPDDIARLAKLGRLNDLPGIGDTTEWIVIEAVGGQTPAYPAKFETTEFRPRITVGEELRACASATATATPAPTGRTAPVPSARLPSPVRSSAMTSTGRPMIRLPAIDDRLRALV